MPPPKAKVPKSKVPKVQKTPKLYYGDRKKNKTFVLPEQAITQLLVQAGVAGLSQSEYLSQLVLGAGSNYMGESLAN